MILLGVFAPVLAGLLVALDLVQPVLRAIRGFDFF